MRYVRTARHPAVAELAADGIELEAFDAHYEAASDLDACYRSIVAALLAAAREHGTVAYAVPGNPAVAERTVDLLRDAAARGDVALDVVPGLSFADAAWSRLGVDPMSTGARVLDARGARTRAARPGCPDAVRAVRHAARPVRRQARAPRPARRADRGHRRAAPRPPRRGDHGGRARGRRPRRRARPPHGALRARGRGIGDR